MNVAEEPIRISRLSVRGRPVGYVPGQWGGSLVAMERGYFPVSETGYRSLSGLGESAVTEEFLEALAKERDRERSRLVAQAGAPLRPEPSALTNYIHVSSLADRAFQHGVFATDGDRAELWSGAYRLYAMIDSDPRFQPASEHSPWTPEVCASALAKTREAMALLLRWANGYAPGAVPVGLFSARAYLALPPRSDGEPAVRLAAVTAELGLDIPGTSAGVRTARAKRESRSAAVASESEAQQLGLFGEGDLPRKAEAPRRGVGI